MKRILIATSLLCATQVAFAEAPGGPNCGWGNMLFEGQSGFVPHFGAMTTNGTSGNATFGMTSGTNGCSVEGTLTYGGEAMVNLGNVMDEFIVDASQGGGEAMTAVAVSMGIDSQDRDHFASTVNSNFDHIFTSADVTVEQVFANMLAVMKKDQRLAKYVA